MLGKYEIVEGKEGLLGEGSFSIVQKGIDRTNNNKIVAVKTYKSGILSAFNDLL